MMKIFEIRPHKHARVEVSGRKMNKIEQSFIFCCSSFFSPRSNCVRKFRAFDSRVPEKHISHTLILVAKIAGGRGIFLRQRFHNFWEQN